MFLSTSVSTHKFINCSFQVQLVGLIFVHMQDHAPVQSALTHYAPEPCLQASQSTKDGLLTAFVASIIRISLASCSCLEKKEKERVVWTAWRLRRE